MQQAHRRPRVFTAQLATGSCTALTHFSLCWPQITGNEQLGRAARLLLPWAGSITLGPAAGAAPAWQCSERLEKFVGRRGFTAPPSAALLSLPLVVPRPLLPGGRERLGSSTMVEGQQDFFPSLDLCFYGTEKGRFHGPGFGSGEEETSVKVIRFAPFFVSQQLRCCAQQGSALLWELVWWWPLPRRLIHRREVLGIPCGLAATTALLSSKISQLSSLLLPF